MKVVTLALCAVAAAPAIAQTEPLVVATGCTGTGILVDGAYPGTIDVLGVPAGKLILLTIGHAAAQFTSGGGAPLPMPLWWLQPTLPTTCELFSSGEVLVPGFTPQFVLPLPPGLALHVQAFVVSFQSGHWTPSETYLVF